MDNLESERLKHSPNVGSLLKISLGLILFTLLSSALVYAETLSVDVEGNSFDVDYTTTGMSVTAIESDTESFSLFLTVDVIDSPGILVITFDRSFFDSIYDGLDDEFFILADGDFTNVDETETTPQSRTLNIEVPSGTDEIEIIGTVFGDSTQVEEPEPEPETEQEAEPETEEPTETVDDTPKTQCGPGTVLEDGACVLDERCGPGTVLEDGVCVLESTSQSTPQSSSVTISKGMGSELLIGTIVAFGIAAAIGVILALISRAKQSKD